MTWFFNWLKRLFNKKRKKENYEANEIVEKANEIVAEAINNNKNNKQYLIPKEQNYQNSNVSMFFDTSEVESETVDIHIGLDLGTSFSKACWNLLDKEKRKIVLWGEPWAEPGQYFLPSKIWLDSNNNLMMAKSNKENVKEISYFKMGVIHNYLIDPVFPQDCQILTDPYRLYTSFYLARCFDWIEKDVLEEEKIYLKGKKINWTGNIGVPISYFDSKTADVFQEVVSVAHAIQKQVSDTEPIHKIDELYQAALSNKTDKSFSIIPELYAEASGLFSDFHTEEGYYALFDVGGGTVDSAVVEFNRRKGLPTVNFLTSEVDFWGMEVLKSRQNQIDELKHGFMLQAAKTIVEAKQKSERAWRDYKYLPIKMCGGGHASKWHINTIYYTYFHNQHSRCGIPPYQIEDLKTDHEDLENIEIDKRHRLLIALGLAMPFGSGPDIVGFPRQNQRIKENDSKRCEDLEEKQKELYGE